LGSYYSGTDWRPAFRKRSSPSKPDRAAAASPASNVVHVMQRIVRRLAEALAPKTMTEQRCWLLASPT